MCAILRARRNNCSWLRFDREVHMSTETAIADYKRFSYRKTAIDVFGYLGISIIWPIFNQFVPLFLQAGNPAIEQQLLEEGKEIPAYKALEAGLCSFAVFTLGIAPGTASIFAGLYYFSSQSAAVSGPTPAALWSTLSATSTVGSSPSARSSWHWH
jgi:hypothetical protein